MRLAIITIALIAASLLPSATPKPKVIGYRMPNAAFFFANNDDYYDAFSGVAVAMCVQDKAQDDSPQAWIAAAKVCRDSRTNEEGDSMSTDGAWRKYVWQAIDVITLMCKANSGKLCESFK